MMSNCSCKKYGLQLLSMTQAQMESRPASLAVEKALYNSYTLSMNAVLSVLQRSFIVGEIWDLARVFLTGTSAAAQLLQISPTIKLRYNTDNTAFIDSVYELYKAFSTAKLAGRDSIWAYVIDNSYSPYFLQEQFDIIVGNPPWLTFRDVENGEYQDELRRIANQYNVLPKNRAGGPTWIWPHCSWRIASTTS
eukprot:TRINITY_DN47745_c0_g1_i1.p1 TRINITY_DN47745_c0_g1~~TRINITY_DN47745_c0_g1_i1.p1  ORF type:complete len:193 (+),score=6.82 TRINITY_DN47745_c0_g1_i1:258-836(+)